MFKIEYNVSRNSTSVRRGQFYLNAFQLKKECNNYVVSKNKNTFFRDMILKMQQTIKFKDNMKSINDDYIYLKNNYCHSYGIKNKNFCSFDYFIFSKLFIIKKTSSFSNLFVLPKISEFFVQKKCLFIGLNKSKYTNFSLGHNISSWFYDDKLCCLFSILNFLADTSLNSIFSLNRKRYYSIIYSLDRDKIFKFGKIYKLFDIFKKKFILSCDYKFWKKFVFKKMLVFLNNKTKCITFILNSKHLGSVFIYFKIINNKSIILDLVTCRNEIKKIFQSHIIYLKNVLKDCGIEVSSINVSSREEFLNAVRTNYDRKFDSKILNHYNTVISKTKSHALRFYELDKNDYQYNYNNINMYV
ncbi:flagellar FliK protein [Buchnera aphidicola str. Bp (Baizongia pistaciae)]|uniref:Flagellar hook-length control protein n=1 Tax=Buchnera aphidicola subsp. Baizongia pistaciae (strain Bp) TaxID=224915 RepID=FLIK_BUCBP|nr:flagellar hook-length control protein FliK [Buchnera aphidicola]Q89AZ5.1 RecName: Full=Flagellar hook-length control protein [Buchnera aphidicola str. Bp (Baizongia pistaciae)]AAO26809.1 flagellar FliK protein [Buchnera aphidicola str. Bp (Baizongia pistaciae)]